MQLFDVLLLSVIVLTAYLGPMVLRRLGPGQRSYGWMVMANLAAALFAFASRYSDGPNPVADTLGAISIGAAVCLVVVPPVLRDLGRRALAGDRLGLARTLADLRELLQPGMGARPERELIDTIMAVRGGREDEIVEQLLERREEAEEPLVRRQIDERICMTYLYARRWDAAVKYFEGAVEGSSRIGSPQLMVEMVRAYCELGRLEAAAELVRALEESPLAREPILSLLISRARLVFLAFVGRTGAVEAIVAPGGPLGAMPDSARHYWAGMARLNAGDRRGAKSSLTRAAEAADDPRARELAERRLHSVDEPGVAGPHSIPPVAAELADRLTVLAVEKPQKSVSKAAAVPKLSGVPLRTVPVTAGLIVLNLAAALLMYAVYGSFADLGALVQSGANVKSATLAGDFWRMPASTFLHVGLTHLALNMYGLWVLGRLVEQFHGSLRFFAIYSTAGIAGAVGSTLFGGATSAGASGAVLGLLGAAIAELGLHRSRYPKHWSNALFGNLLFLTAANVAIGFLYPVIDQSAHVAGLLAGGLVAAALSRKTSFEGATWVRVLASFLAALGVLAIAYAGFGAATTDYRDTLRLYGTEVRDSGNLRVRMPANWIRHSEHEFYDPGVGLGFLLASERAELGIDERISQQIEEEIPGLSGSGGRQPGARTTRLSLPTPWRASEIHFRADGEGGEQRFRRIVFGRSAGDQNWVGDMYFPHALGDAFEAALVEICRSVAPGPGGPTDDGIDPETVDPLP